MQWIKTASQGLGIANFSEKLQETLLDFYARIEKIEVFCKQIKDFNEHPKVQTFFTMVILEKLAPEFANVPLNLVFEKFSVEEDRAEHIRYSLHLTKEIQTKRKVDTTAINRILEHFKYFRIIFKSCLTLCEKLLMPLGSKETVWTLLLFVLADPEVSKDLGSKKWSETWDVIEFLASVMGLLVLKNNPRVKIESFLEDFHRVTTYQVLVADFNSKSKIIEDKIPDFHSKEFSLAKYQNEYIRSLKGEALNFLCFLNTSRSAPVTPYITTPLQKEITKKKGMLSYNELNLGTTSNMPSLNEIPAVKNLAMVSEKQLKSPKVKKDIDSLNIIKDHSEMVEWVKSLINEVKLSQFDLEDGSTTQVSTYFFEFLKINYIRQNFQEIAKLFKKIEQKEIEVFIKFYFKVLEILIKNEFSEVEKRDSLQNVLNNKNFMTTLLAFCYELRLFMLKPMHQGLNKEIEKIFDFRYIFDFYKILLNFIQVCYKNLPKLIKVHIVTLEYSILLQELWVKPLPGEEYIPKKIFISEEGINLSVVNTIKQFMVERLYIIALAVDIPEEKTNKIWNSFQKLLQEGFDKESEEVEYQFKYNCHLDVILLSVMYEWIYANKVELHLCNLISAYKDKVLFPHANILEDVKSFGRLNKNILLEAIKDALIAINPRSIQMNSTPPFHRERQKPFRNLSTLDEHLMNNLVKKPLKEVVTGYSAVHRNPTTHTQVTNNSFAFNLFNLGDVKKGEANVSVNEIVPQKEEDEKSEEEENEGNSTPKFGAEPESSKK